MRTTGRLRKLLNSRLLRRIFLFKYQVALIELEHLYELAGEMVNETHFLRTLLIYNSRIVTGPSPIFPVTVRRHTIKRVCTIGDKRVLVRYPSFRQFQYPQLYHPSFPNLQVVSNQKFRLLLTEQVFSPQVHFVDVFSSQQHRCQKLGLINFVYDPEL